MGWLDFLGHGKPAARDQQLVGVWSAPGIELDIRADGTMDYIVIESDKRQIMKLTYRVERDEIVSNQPSAPREERTKFWFEDRNLILMFGGERSSLQRSKP